MRNLETYYRDTKKWSAGPHLFIDDRQIWVFTPLNMSGVHSPSWNKLSLGIEMLGDYSKDDFTLGRGFAVRQNAVSAMATLSAALGLDPITIKLHKEDPLTDHKDCPGKSVIKSQVISEVQQLIQLRHGNEH
ncbi:MAG: N-acetylmuramoyl-L-alanine amidase [Bacteroidota bacterium]